MVPFRHWLVVALVLLSSSPAWGQPTPMTETESISPIGRHPRFQEGQKRRFHIWYEDGVWHLRCTTNKNEPATFNGAILADKGAIQVVGGDGEGRVRKPRKADLFTVRGNRLDFLFRNGGQLDGLDFKVSPNTTTLHFDLYVNKDANPAYIFIGKTGRHPSKAKFALPAYPEPTR